jgi:hypothetical protein
MCDVRGKFLVPKPCKQRNSSEDDIKMDHREICTKVIKLVTLASHIYLFIYNGGFP